MGCCWLLISKRLFQDISFVQGRIFCREKGGSNRLCQGREALSSLEVLAGMRGVQCTRVIWKRDEQWADSADAGNYSAQPLVKPGEVAEYPYDADWGACLENLPEQAWRKAESSGPSCIELSVRLGEALETVVWKCQLSICQKENCKSPPDQKILLVRTNL